MTGGNGLMVTLAVPVMPLVVAWMVAEPVPELGAVYSPLLLMEPMPPAAIDQVKLLGCAAIG